MDTRTLKAFGLFLVLALGATFGGLADTLVLSPTVAFHREPWRALTHLFVHRDIWHLVMNLGGLVGLVYLWPSLLSCPTHVCRVALPYAMLSPYVATGVVYGASGLLHGLFCYGTVMWSFSTRHRSRYAAVLLTGMATKLLSEATGLSMAEGVAWHFHVLGAVSGSAAGLCCLVLSKSRVGNVACKLS